MNVSLFATSLARVANSANQGKRPTHRRAGQRAVRTESTRPATRDLLAEKRRGVHYLRQSNDATTQAPGREKTARVERAIVPVFGLPDNRARAGRTPPQSLPQ